MTHGENRNNVENMFNEILFSLYKYLVSIEVDPPRFKG